ncbi:MAG TPA: hypothetical protein VFH61_03670 [Thermoleophilia bacterium]|nr:hypothetical protein [Thermoleophilia bacterium]
MARRRRNIAPPVEYILVFDRDGNPYHMFNMSAGMYTLKSVENALRSWTERDEARQEGYAPFTVISTWEGSDVYEAYLDKRGAIFSGVGAYVKATKSGIAIPPLKKWEKWSGPGWHKDRRVHMRTHHYLENKLGNFTLAPHAPSKAQGVLTHYSVTFMPRGALKTYLVAECKKKSDCLKKLNQFVKSGAKTNPLTPVESQELLGRASHHISLVNQYTQSGLAPPRKALNVGYHAGRAEEAQHIADAYGRKKNPMPPHWRVGPRGAEYGWPHASDIGDAMRVLIKDMKRDGVLKRQRKAPDGHLPEDAKRGDYDFSASGTGAWLYVRADQADAVRQWLHDNRIPIEVDYRRKGTFTHWPHEATFALSPEVLIPLLGRTKTISQADILATRDLPGEGRAAYLKRMKRTNPMAKPKKQKIGKIPGLRSWSKVKAGRGLRDGYRYQMRGFPGIEFFIFPHPNKKSAGPITSYYITDGSQTVKKGCKTKSDCVKAAKKFAKTRANPANPLTKQESWESINDARNRMGSASRMPRGHLRSQVRGASLEQFSMVERYADSDEYKRIANRARMEAADAVPFTEDRDLSPGINPLNIDEQKYLYGQSLLEETRGKPGTYKRKHAQGAAHAMREIGHDRAQDGNVYPPLAEDFVEDEGARRKVRHGHIQDINALAMWREQVEQQGPGRRGNPLTQAEHDMLDDAADIHEEQSYYYQDGGLGDGAYEMGKSVGYRRTSEMFHGKHGDYAQQVHQKRRKKREERVGQLYEERTDREMREIRAAGKGDRPWAVIDLETRQVYERFRTENEAMDWAQTNLIELFDAGEIDIRRTNPTKKKAKRKNPAKRDANDLTPTMRDALESMARHPGGKFMFRGVEQEYGHGVVAHSPFKALVQRGLAKKLKTAYKITAKGMKVVGAKKLRPAKKAKRKAAKKNPRIKRRIVAGPGTWDLDTKIAYPEGVFSSRKAAVLDAQKGLKATYGSIRQAPYVKRAVWKWADRKQEAGRWHFTVGAK